MKRFLILSLIMMVAIGLTAADSQEYLPQRHSAGAEVTTASGQRADMSRAETDNQLRDEEVWYEQDFNDGWQGWTTFDRTFGGAMWHLSQFMAHGGEGYSWWMADPEIGGYYNGQYTYLDTPQIMVTADNSTLTFNVNWAIEELGNWQDPENPEITFDGWDGANVRISTDNGESWSVISGSPEYNSTSMFAFGRIHGEGPNVPGWGGTSNGWRDASFELSEYIGQNVRIRFAFASDNAIDSVSNPELYSILIDNISLGDYEQNFDDAEEHGMSYGTLIPVGGDLWRIAQTTPPPPAPPYAAVCQNEEGTYNRNMYNFIISPLIEMPDGGDIRADFSLRGDFLVNHEGNFPDCNLWGWQVSPDSGATWYAMSNPYGDPDGSNFVFVDTPSDWQSVVNSYQGLDGIINDYASEVLQFRIYFQTNDDEPIGDGMMIDQFRIYHSQYLPASTGLTAREEDGVVHLEWSPPGIGGETGWIHWDSGENDNAVGLSGDDPEFDVAARFSPSDIEPYIGGQITKVRFFPNHTMGSNYTLKVWTGLNGAQEIYTQNIPIADLTNQQWNEIELEEPVNLGMGEHYWIGYHVSHPPEVHPAGMDAGPAIPDRGDMIRTGAVWVSLHQANPNINGNWNIQALVEAPNGERMALGNETRPPEGPDGYKVYRSVVSGEQYEEIGEVTDPEITVFTDTSPVRGAINYYVVRTVYGQSQSAPTNEARAFVLAETATLIAYDDGEADFGYNAGSGNQLAVLYENPSDEDVYLTYVNVYVEERRTGSMILMARLADENNEPGQLFAQFVQPPNRIFEGWNYIPTPQDPDNPVTVPAGQDFFVIIQEATNASAIGVDENNVGSSHVRLAASDNVWEPYEDGNFMIRAIIDSNWLDAEKEEMPAVRELTAMNYPNPFNPETTIVFNMPQSGEVKVSVYNTRGQLVQTLVNERLNAGSHEILWDGKDQSGAISSSGVYFYRIETEEQSINRRMILLK